MNIPNNDNSLITKEYEDFVKDPGYVQILADMHLRIKAVFIAKIILLLMALKPFIFKVYGYLSADLPLAQITFTFYELIEALVPFTLGVLWFIIKKSFFAIICCLGMLILFLYLVAINPQASPTLIVNILILVVLYFAVRMQAQIERFDRNFKLLHDIPRYRQYKKLLLKEQKRKLKAK